MRIHPIKSVFRLGLCCAFLSLSAAGFLACADALHLDPPGTTTGTGGSKGDGGTTSCVSNPDCTYPKPVCDTVHATCVECLVISDCAGKPGTVCSAGVCSCAPSASAPTTPLTYCESATPACVDTSSDIDNCGTCGNACFGCMAGKCTSPWTVASTTGAPDGRASHVAVWTGSQMFVWGGQGAAGALASGGLYDPVKNVWTTTSATGAPEPRWDATAVWDDVDNRVLVWGGTDGTNYFADGGQYDPATDTWTAISALAGTDASTGVEGRAHHTAVWAKGLMQLGNTTNAMIVWGGITDGKGTTTGDGGIYDPALKMWVTTIPQGITQPLARAYHAAVWSTANNYMLLLGGSSDPTTLADSTPALYDYAPSQMWNSNSVTPAPSPRQKHTGLWDPKTMTFVVWGGVDGAGTTYFQDGASLDSTSTWSSLGGSGTPPAGRVDHSSAVVTGSTGSALVIFGGDNATSSFLSDGWSTGIGASGTWAQIPAPGPSARRNHTAVSTGGTMIVWGGETASGVFTNSGAIYTAP